MKGEKEKSRGKRRIAEVWRDGVLDASEEEFRKLLEAEGEDFNRLAEGGRVAVQKALDKAECGAAPSGNSAKDEPEELHRGMGALIRLLRRKGALSQKELSHRAGIEEEEVRRIEADGSYCPTPRTLFQLELYFKLPGRSLAILSGAVTTQGSELREEAIRFAAYSTGMGKLNREEKKILGKFVKFLVEYTEQQNEE